MTDLQRTPLYQAHQTLGAKLVDFGGWALPVNYGSQIDEHHAVRKNCGIFDVSHMTVSDVTGPETMPFLSKLLANDIAKTNSVAGKALYSCMLNEQGGVIDDLIVYGMSEQHCRLVTNAGTREKDMAWISKESQEFNVEFTEKPNLALIAVQGPKAIALCAKVLSKEHNAILANLNRFQGAFLSSDESLFVGRTGYTGEDGVEFIVDQSKAEALWQSFIENDVQPCGLGARDTLRLEAGMALYGNDLDEQHTPIDSGLKWSVSIQDDREFIGKSALHVPAKHSLIGLVLLDRGVLRSHQKVILDDREIGEVTSGTFSPTLEKSIALARIESSAEVQIGDVVGIAVRNKQLQAQVVKYPFVKNGESAI